MTDTWSKIAEILNCSPWATTETFLQKTDELIARARAADELLTNFERGRAVLIRNRAEGKLQRDKNFPGGLSAAFTVSGAEIDEELAVGSKRKQEPEEKRVNRIPNRSEVKLICNRAAELEKEIPHLSFSAAFTMANREFQRNEYEAPKSEEERAKRIAARAAQLQKEQPYLSFSAAWQLAMRKESVPPYHVRGFIRHLDERIAAATEGH
jgi:hypothetical protein